MMLMTAGENTISTSTLQSEMMININEGMLRECNPAEIPYHYGAVSKVLEDFAQIYTPIHLCSSLAISVLGMAANILTVIILSRHDMRTPTNRLYALMAAADVLTMLLYSMYAASELFYPYTPATATTSRALFLVIYADLSMFAHTLSVSVLVAVTIFRVLILKLQPASAKQHCSLERANVTAAVIFVLSVAITAPNIALNTMDKCLLSAAPENAKIEDGNVRKIEEEDEEREVTTIQWEQISSSNVIEATTSSYGWFIIQRDDQILKMANFWILAILVKLLPCILLTLTSFLIVRTLKEAEARRRRLQGNKHQSAAATTSTTTTITPGIASTQPPRSVKQHGGGGGKTPSRSASGADPRIRSRTIMLLALLTVFLVTEFPQGIMTIVAEILGENFWREVYMPLGMLMDMLTLINAGVNFVLFSSMSTEFRTALNKQLSQWFPCYAGLLIKAETRTSIPLTVRSPKQTALGHGAGGDQAVQLLPPPPSISTSEVVTGESGSSRRQVLSSGIETDIPATSMTLPSVEYSALPTPQPTPIIKIDADMEHSSGAFEFEDIEIAACSKKPAKARSTSAVVDAGTSPLEASQKSIGVSIKPWKAAVRFAKAANLFRSSTPGVSNSVQSRNTTAVSRQTSGGGVGGGVRGIASQTIEQDARLSLPTSSAAPLLQLAASTSPSKRPSSLPPMTTTFIVTDAEERL